MDTQLSEQQIIHYLKSHQKAKVNELWRELGFSRQLVQRKLKEMVLSGIVEKSGKPPLVFYYLKAIEQKKEFPNVSLDLVDFINKFYLYVSPLGELVYGFNGFSKWVDSINESKRIKELSQEYKHTIEESQKYFDKNGFVNATEKIKNTFSETFLDSVYYLDFYSLPKFGKTKLGQLVLYSKQAQKYELIRALSTETKPRIEDLIKAENINAISFIPPTVPRNVQFIKELEKMLNINLPKIHLSKAYVGSIPVAQKTLSRLEERVKNASRTIFVNQSARYQRVLLIDDAVGSGASLNETAKKLKSEGLAKTVVGFAIVGSYKGFDVIREV